MLRKTACILLLFTSAVFIFVHQHAKIEHVREITQFCVFVKLFPDPLPGTVFSRRPLPSPGAKKGGDKIATARLLKAAVAAGLLRIIRGDTVSPPIANTGAKRCARVSCRSGPSVIPAGQPFIGFLIPIAVFEIAAIKPQQSGKPPPAGRPGAHALISSITKHSMMSPTLISLNFSTCMPHS